MRTKCAARSARACASGALRASQGRYAPMFRMTAGGGGMCLLSAPVPTKERGRSIPIFAPNRGTGQKHPTPAKQSLFLKFWGCDLLASLPLFQKGLTKNASPASLQRIGEGGGELVAALVVGVTVVTFDPDEGDGVFFKEFEQAFPEVGVEGRGFVAFFPAARAP